MSNRPAPTWEGTEAPVKRKWPLSLWQTTALGGAALIAFAGFIGAMTAEPEVRTVTKTVVEEKVKEVRVPVPGPTRTVQAPIPKCNPSDGTQQLVCTRDDGRFLFVITDFGQNVFNIEKRK